MEFIFWTSVLLVVYPYFLYPVLLLLIAAGRQFKHDTIFLSRGQERRLPNLKDEELPTISMIVPAYNEAKVIEAKIKNCLELDYPRDKVQFIIASDASTDSTDAIVERYKSFGIDLISYSERSGKLGVINRTVALARGEVLAFSDANTMWEPMGLKRLARHFGDEKVGGVCGQQVFISGQGILSGEEAYWLYENILKWLEGRLGTLVGANGGMYALRKELFHTIPPHYLADDLLIPMKVLEKGYRMIYEPEAKALEEVATDVGSVFRRRVRVASAGYQALGNLKKFLNPAMGLAAFCFWSRKVIRWGVPFFLMAAFLSNLILAGRQSLYLILLFIQMAFYLSGLLGCTGRMNRGFIQLAHFFVSMNAALLFGSLRFLAGRCQGTWTSPDR